MYYLPLRYSLSVRCGFLCIDAFAMAMADPLSCSCAISSPHGQKSQTGKKLALLRYAIAITEGGPVGGRHGSCGLRLRVRPRAARPVTARTPAQFRMARDGHASRTVLMH